MRRLEWAKVRQGALVMAVVLAALWLIELVDIVLNHSLDGLGIRPWNLSGLLGIVLAPLLHAGIPHLVANSVPLFVLGTVLWASGRREFGVVTAVAWVASGLVAWLFTPPGFVVIGASGVILGWAAYLIVRGCLTREAAHVVIAVVIALLYGSVLLGVFPLRVGASWQGHLGGAIGGVLAAWLLFARKRPRRR